MLHAWKPEHRIRDFPGYRSMKQHEGLCGSWKRRQKAAAYQSNISVQFLWRCRHETAPSSTAPIRLLVQKCIVYKFTDILSCAHLTFRLCFLWRKWYGTLRQAEYFLATIAGQKNVGKIHPWRVETPIHWITRVPELSGTPRITTNIPTSASAVIIFTCLLSITILAPAAPGLCSRTTVL